MNAISDYCIYTIVHGDRLLLGARNAGPAVFHQTKAWITGYRLWLNAEADGLLMPVLLADSTDCSKLLYWGVLTSVSLADGGTTFTVDRLRRLRHDHRPQELTLRSSGRHIAPQFIRPYAICRTPGVIREQSRTTRSTARRFGFVAHGSFRRALPWENDFPAAVGDLRRSAYNSEHLRH